MPRNRAGSAIAISASVTAIVIWFINPPSLSGAGGLASLIIGAAVFIYVAAWFTTLLMGKELDELRIVIYQDTLVRDFGWEPEILVQQVERTVRHEVAHHLGWDEGGVRSLGL